MKKKLSPSAEKSLFEDKLINIHKYTKSLQDTLETRHCKIIFSKKLSDFVIQINKLIEQIIPSCQYFNSLPPSYVEFQKNILNVGQDQRKEILKCVEIACQMLHEYCSSISIGVHEDSDMVLVNKIQDLLYRTEFEYDIITLMDDIDYKFEQIGTAIRLGKFSLICDDSDGDEMYEAIKNEDHDLFYKLRYNYNNHESSNISNLHKIIQALLKNHDSIDSFMSCRIDLSNYLSYFHPLFIKLIMMRDIFNQKYNQREDEGFCFLKMIEKFVIKKGDFGAMAIIYSLSRLGDDERFSKYVEKIFEKFIEDENTQSRHARLSEWVDKHLFHTLLEDQENIFFVVEYFNRSSNLIRYILDNNGDFYKLFYEILDKNNEKYLATDYHKEKFFNMFKNFFRTNVAKFSKSPKYSEILKLNTKLKKDVYDKILGDLRPELIAHFLYSTLEDVTKNVKNLSDITKFHIPELAYHPELSICHDNHRLLFSFFKKCIDNADVKCGEIMNTQLLNVLFLSLDEEENDNFMNFMKQKIIEGNLQDDIKELYENLLKSLVIIFSQGVVFVENEGNIEKYFLNFVKKGFGVEIEGVASNDNKLSKILSCFVKFKLGLNNLTVKCEGEKLKLTVHKDPNLEQDPQFESFKTILNEYFIEDIYNSFCSLSDNQEIMKHVIPNYEDDVNKKIWEEFGRDANTEELSNFIKDIIYNEGKNYGENASNENKNFAADNQDLQKNILSKKKNYLQDAMNKYENEKEKMLVKYIISSSEAEFQNFLKNVSKLAADKDDLCFSLTQIIATRMCKDNFYFEYGAIQKIMDQATKKESQIYNYISRQFDDKIDVKFISMVYEYESKCNSANNVPNDNNHLDSVVNHTDQVAQANLEVVGDNLQDLIGESGGDVQEGSSL